MIELTILIWVQLRRITIVHDVGQADVPNFEFADNSAIENVSNSDTILLIVLWKLLLDEGRHLTGF
jgi:hypothetical protein